MRLRLSRELLSLIAATNLAATLLGCTTDSASSSDPADTSVGSDTGGADTTPAADVPEVARALVAAPLVPSAAAGSTVQVQVTLTPASAGVDLTAHVAAGGGSALPATTDALGKATLSWTLGVAPIPQRLTIAAEGVELTVAIDATRDDALTAQPFGKVAQFFDDGGLVGSTEDLVFARDGLVMGAPDGLLLVTAAGDVSRLPLTGEPPKRGWGVASHPDGALWVVDLGEQRLVRVDAEGDARTVLTGDGDTPFDGLNDVEVAPDQSVYATDPCLGRVVRVDAAGAGQTGSLVFDRATQGGPNGLAFDAQGRLYLSTENTVLLCEQDVADYDAPLAGIYRTTPTANGLGTLEAVQTGIGVFGDGLAFDAEGNLYGIFTSVQGVGIGENAVWVLPGGEGPARRVVVAPPETLYANLAFGQGDFGATQLYLSLLSAAPFTGSSSIGLHRVALGVAGAPR